MTNLFGRTYTRKEFRRHVGDILQVGGVRPVEYADGSERGVRAAEFRTGSGLNFVVLLDRGMDISACEFDGQAMNWRAPCGDVGPAHFEPEGLRWLRTFCGGMVCTCGMTYAGAPCVDQSEELGLHGRLTSIPARNSWVGGHWDGDEYIMAATGEMRESVLFGENLLLKRRVWARLGESRFFIEDSVTNEGFRSSPLMFLYHVNAGFPLMDEGTELITAAESVEPRDADAAEGMDAWHRFGPPTANYREQCFYHDFKTDSQGEVLLAVANRNFGAGKGFGYYLRYDKKKLPFFTQWKMQGEGEYVQGTEPANCRVQGRDWERSQGTLEHIEPGETREFGLELGALGSIDDISAIEEEIAALRQGEGRQERTR
ncbi:aldose 1-epimerase family protein [Candidatus Hydrogenedentota bacterium]